MASSPSSQMKWAIILLASAAAVSAGRWKTKFAPGHGRTLVKADGKSYKFLSSRTHKAHMLKRNPREVTWTVLYRRKHKKGLEEETAKKRNKRTTKFQRAVVGATLQDIMAKRRQPRNVTREPLSSSVPWLEPHFKTSWLRGTKSQRSGRPRESRLSELPRSQRKQLSPPLEPRKQLPMLKHRRPQRKQLSPPLEPRKQLPMLKH